MKDLFKAIGAAISLAAFIYKTLKKAEEKHEKEAIYKAIAERDLSKLRELVFK